MYVHVCMHIYMCVFLYGFSYIYMMIDCPRVYIYTYIPLQHIETRYFKNIHLLISRMIQIHPQ